MEPLIETWQIAARLNIFFWTALDDEQRSTKAEKGKSVFEHFGHIHAVRLMWIKAAAPELMDGLEKVVEPSEMEPALVASAAAIESLILSAGSPEGRIKGFKPHASAFVGYLIAHEAYHRAQADLALRLASRPVDDRTHYGLWEWGVR